jgi:hypothetical protein
MSILGSVTPWKTRVAGATRNCPSPCPTPHIHSTMKSMSSARSLVQSPFSGSPTRSSTAQMWQSCHETRSKSDSVYVRAVPEERHWVARGSSKRLPADPCPVRMGEGALGGSWRTPLDGGPLVPRALLPWQIADAAGLRRRGNGFWHCALLVARPALLSRSGALLRPGLEIFQT